MFVGSRCSHLGSFARSPGPSALPQRASPALPGRLARENATRNPGRTAVTASALMIGLALVTFVDRPRAGNPQLVGLDRAEAGLGGLHPHDELRLGLVLARRGGDARGEPGVESVSSVRSAAVQVGESRTTVTGLDTATSAASSTSAGSTARTRRIGKLGSDGAIVLKSFAEDHHLQRRRRLPRPVRPTASESASSCAASTSRRASTRCSAASRSRTASTGRSSRTRGTRWRSWRRQDDASRAALESALNRYPDVSLNTESRVRRRTRTPGSTAC